ncbi:hypothetical protein PXK30_05225 [Phaeobacter gallaeciensis]|uniref:hypothetical protein n=1 Tax=Phaeobacter gallaeciensis TaxID=60890 RepID=UPI00237FB6B6|nr:hypothetical protein [Phaeobacter gallaeciensis]MDE4302867.1 hypothetical protein [Phaeobacter gallaeciensis]MDE4307040.1 hypothetical protein [Phaeobacter gallaeciensis]MDE4311505.1 hypothetical protein [Phaeobacter gallaeciensis]MDE4316188.1 hypothetical protein [Phaeobacter gallaeciensis]MDE4320432.1 hypothetical protein [Phaeobacter gallaeciensis]
MAQIPSPRIARIAYQIWWLIEDTAGECTLRDMATFTGASIHSCSQICRYRGWSGRYRKMACSHAVDNGPQMIGAFDAELSVLSGEAA